MGLRELKAGSVLGTYQIVSEIGSGSEGVVFLADHVNRKQLVALKVVDELDFPHIDEAFRANQLGDPCICTVHETGRDRGLAFIAMSVVDGETFDALLEEHPQRAHPDTWLPWLRQVGESLANAHEHGLAHGSLRPSSLIVRHSGRPVILDFGLRGEGLGPEQLADVDLRCFARIARKCLDGCERELVPEYVRAALERASGKAEVAPFATMREFLSALEPPPAEEEGGTIDVRAFFARYRRQLRVGAGILIAAGGIVLAMGLGTGGREGGGAPFEPGSSAPPAQRQAGRVLTEKDIARAEKAWEYVKERPLELPQLESKQRELRRELLLLPEDEGLRLRLARLQLEAVTLLSEGGRRGEARKYLAEAQRTLKELPRQQVHWEEVARHEGRARLLQGRMLLADGNAEAACDAFDEGLRLFRGRRLDPEASKVQTELAAAMRAARGH